MNTKYSTVTRRLLLALLSLITVTTVALTTGPISTPVDFANTDTPESVISALQSADKIVAKKSDSSYGSQWTVIADDQEVGTIRSEVVKSLGATYSLFSNADKIVASEGEAYRIANNQVKLYDHKGKFKSEIKSKSPVLFSEYKIVDADDNIQGVANEKISSTLKFDIKGNSGSIDFTINKALLSFNDKVTIDRKNVDSSLSAVDVLWLAVIASDRDLSTRGKLNKS